MGKKAITDISGVFALDSHTEHLVDRIDKVQKISVREAFKTNLLGPNWQVVI